MNKRTVCEGMAKSLREFGYPDVTSDMVFDCLNAYNEGADMPHGVIGRFVERQIEDLKESAAELNRDISSIVTR